MLIQAILLGLVAFIAQSEYALEHRYYLVRLLLVFYRDCTRRCKGRNYWGATLELAFIGSFSVGAAIPPRCSDRRHFGNGLCDYRWCWNRNGVAAWSANCDADH